jgi:hypothetical protein
MQLPIENIYKNRNTTLCTTINAINAPELPAHDD